MARLPGISVADLVRIAQSLHSKLFSRDVAAALGVPYEGGDINARYSVARDATLPAEVLSPRGYHYML